MFNLFVIYRLKNKKRKEFLDALSSAGIIEATHKEPGCIRYEIYLPMVDEDKILLLEQWESEPLQKEHIHSDHIRKLAEIKKEYVIETEIKRFEFRD